MMQVKNLKIFTTILGCFGIFLIIVYFYVKIFHRIEPDLPFTFSYLYFFGTLISLIFCIYRIYKLVKSFKEISNIKESKIFSFILPNLFKYSIIYIYMVKYIYKLLKFLLRYYKKIPEKYYAYIYFVYYVFPRILLTITLFIDIVIFHKIYYIIYVSYIFIVILIIQIHAYMLYKYIEKVITEVSSLFLIDMKINLNNVPIYQFKFIDYELIHKFRYPTFIYFKIFVEATIVQLFYDTIIYFEHELWVKYTNLLINLNYFIIWTYVLFKIITNFLFGILILTNYYGI